MVSIRHSSIQDWNECLAHYRSLNHFLLQTLKNYSRQKNHLILFVLVNSKDTNSRRDSSKNFSSDTAFSKTSFAVKLRKKFYF